MCIEFSSVLTEFIREKSLFSYQIQYIHEMSELQTNFDILNKITWILRISIKLFTSVSVETFKIWNKVGVYIHTVRNTIIIICVTHLNKRFFWYTNVVATSIALKWSNYRSFIAQSNWIASSLVPYFNIDKMQTLKSYNYSNTVTTVGYIAMFSSAKIIYSNLKYAFFSTSE